MCAPMVSIYSALHAAELATHAAAVARHKIRSFGLTCTSCRSYAKGFGAVGALYAGSECVIEKVPDIMLMSIMHAGCFSAALARIMLQRSMDTR